MSQLDRRAVLKGAALLGAGAAAAQVGSVSALAATPDGAGALLTESRSARGVVLPTTPGYLYRYFAGPDFFPLSQTQVWSDGSGYMSQSSGPYGGFIRVLDLAQAAVISEIAWTILKPDANQHSFVMGRIEPSAGSFTILANTATTGPGTGVQVITMPVSPAQTIDNTEFTFYIGWVGPALATHGLWGARVAYSNPSNTVVYLPSPYRVADTRPASGPIGPVTGPLANNASYDFPVAGVGPIPAKATGIVGTLTAAEFTGNGYLYIYPTGAPASTASSLNYGAVNMGAIATAFNAKAGTAGKLTVYNSGALTQAIIDVVGYIL